MQKLKINKYTDTKGEIRYYIACTIRNGNKTSTKNLVSLGKRSEIILEHPDIDNYLKERLNEATVSGLFDNTVQIKYSFNKQIKPGDVKRYDVGDIFVNRVFNEINFGTFLDTLSERHQFKYSFKEVVLFLISQRLISPFSKRKMYNTAKKKSIITPSFTLINVYRAMDVLLEHKDEILKYLYNNTPCLVKRNYSILYFDGTNTYMETEIEEGFKARGKGKRNEIEPLVSFGLILDGSGIPVSYITFKGSGSECKQLIPLEEQIESDFKHTDFVMITDAALSSKEIRCFNSIANKGFITVLPVRKMSQDKLDRFVFDKKEWNTNDEKYTTPDSIIKNYEELSEELEICENEKRIKEINEEIKRLLNVFLTKRHQALEDLKPVKYRNNIKEKEYIDEDYLISFSLKYALRERKQRDRLIEKAYKLIEKEGVKKKYKAGDPRKYIQDTEITKDGEIATIKVKEINSELIDKEKKLDGYYAVATSLVKEKDEQVIFWMKQRWMIEDTFLIMKQFFGFRPINHSKDNRIDIHFFTVFLTTLFYRYIQNICTNSEYESLQDLSDEDLLELIKEFSITERKDYFFPDFDNNQIQQDFQKLFNVNISNEIMKKSYITKEFKKKISK